MLFTLPHRLLTRSTAHRTVDCLGLPRRGTRLVQSYEWCYRQSRSARRSRARPPGRLDGRAGSMAREIYPTRPHDSHHDRAVRRGRRGAGPGGPAIRVDRPGPEGRPARDRVRRPVGVDHVVAVNNGTTALIAALQVLDLQPGDEVITSPFTFVATLNAILEAGATAVLRRHPRGRLQHRSRIDRSARSPTAPKVLHAGAPLRPDGRHGPLVEHRRGERPRASSRTPRRRTARRSTDAAPGRCGIGCFSLYATKNLTTGEGGVITTDDDALADRLRVLRNQGMRARYEYEMAGNNYRHDRPAGSGRHPAARAATTTGRAPPAQRRPARRAASTACPASSRPAIRSTAATTCGTSTRFSSRTRPGRRATSSSSELDERRRRLRRLLPEARVRLRLLPRRTPWSRVSDVPVAQRIVAQVRLAAGPPAPHRRRPRPHRRRRSRRGRSVRCPQ